MLHLYLQMQPAILDCEMGHPLTAWDVTDTALYTAEEELNFMWVLFYEMVSAMWKPVFVPCFSIRTPAEPSESNTISNRALAGNGITATAYEAPPRLCSLFPSHNPFPQIPFILLKNLVGESVSLTHVSQAAIIVQAAIAREIFLIFAA